MEIAFTILGLGALDAVITGILKHTKNGDKIMFVRVGMYLTVAIISLQELTKLFDYVRQVFGV
jgi:hypothetical protein